MKKNKLYLIRTPIGNMDDISKLMIDTLNYVDILFCEDTRTTSILLNYLKEKMMKKNMKEKKRH